VGKQSRRKGERAAGEAQAARYLRRLGLPLKADGVPYRRMAEADPAWSARVSELDDRSVALAEAAVADRGTFDEVTRAKYALIYRDLDTALAEYASRAVAVAAAWLPWWFDHHPPARRLLDVGCGAGVLTCAYGLALPDAEVVGIDFVPEAVACAEELARRAGAGNVSFAVADFTAPAAAPGEFDQVVAVTALGDAGLYPRRRPGADPFSSLAEVDGPGRHFTAEGVSALAGSVAPGGWLLAYDRTPEVTQALWLGASLLHAGIDLDLRQAAAEDLTEDGERRTFTRLVGRHRPVPEQAPSDLASWLKAITPPAFGPGWHDELRFERLKAADAALVWGVEIDYAPHSDLVERKEVWAQGTRAYRWETNTLGLRELAPVQSVGAAVGDLSAYGQKWAAAGLQVRPYPA
jgi:SAM-dependent methyltransferase